MISVSCDLCHHSIDWAEERESFISNRGKHDVVHFCLSCRLKLERASRMADEAGFPLKLEPVLQSKP